MQLNWLDNQITKIANDGAMSFANVDVEERAYNKMKKESLITSNSDIEHFISIYLSEIGLTKLITTLRVYKKRNNTERLQVEITTSNKSRLNQLVTSSGKTKIEIINDLIKKAYFEELQKFKE